MFGEISTTKTPDDITIHTSYGNTVHTVKCRVFCEESVGITNGNGKIIRYDLNNEDTLRFMDIVTDDS